MKKYMRISQIHLEKSRTIDTKGVVSRDTYRKLIVGMTMDLDETDDHDICYSALSLMIDEKLNIEIEKLKQKQDNKFKI